MEDIYRMVDQKKTRAKLALRNADRVYVETGDDFYAPHVNGWYEVQNVDAERCRWELHAGATRLKTFVSERGVGMIIEHEYDRYGDSTWDAAKQRCNWIYISVRLYQLTEVNPLV